jgi:CheY-like chemotaxis protein
MKRTSAVCMGAVWAGLQDPCLFPSTTTQAVGRTRSILSAQPRMSAPNSTSLVVLLVEDHADTRQIYADFLGEAFEVLQAANGEEALDVVKQRVPALLITDLSLPGIDGFELIRRLRDSPSTRQVPAICLSGHGGRAHEARGKAVGCDRILEKPCLPTTLAEAAQSLLREGRRADA